MRIWTRSTLLRFAVLSVALVTVFTASPGIVPAAQTVHIDTTAELRASLPASITEERVNEFVGLWTSRIASGAIQKYLDTPGIPKEIKDEGFHSLDGATQDYLVKRLVAGLVETSTGLRPRLVAEDNQQAQLRSMISMFIFHKESIEAARKDIESENKTPSAAPKVKAKPDKLRTELDALEAQIQRKPDHARAYVGRAGSKPPTSLPSLPQPSVPAAANDEPLDTIFRLIEQTLRSLGLDPVADVVSFKFKLCAKPSLTSPQSAAVCSGPTNVNAPTQLDVNGDGTPDVVGTLQVLPDVLGLPAIGLRFQLLLERVATSLTHFVYAAIELPSVGRVVEAGLDGSLSGLGPHSALAFAFRANGLPIPGAPDFGVSLDLQQTQPLGELPIIFALDTLEGASEPIYAKINTGPIPVFTSTLNFRKTNGGFHIDNTATSALSLEIGYLSANGQKILATLKDLPNLLSLDVGVNGPATTVEWTASGAITSIGLEAVFDMVGRRWYAGLGIEHIPANWFVEILEDGSFTFDASTDPIGSVYGYLSNRGDPRPVRPDNHISATLNTDEFDLLATFRINDIAFISYAPSVSDTPESDGWDVHLQIGGGGPFTAEAALFGSDYEISARLGLSPLPEDIRLSQAGQTFTYQASQNTTLTAALNAGFGGGLAATPEPVVQQGITVEDGYDNGYGIKLRLLMTGMPKTVSYNGEARKLSLLGYAPTVDCAGPGAFSCIEIAVTLDSIPFLPAIEFGLTQNGIPIGVPIDFVFEATQSTGNRIATGLSYTAKQAGTNTYVQFGALDVLIRIGPLEATLDVSNIPGKIAGEIYFEKPGTVSAQEQGKAGILITLEPNGISSFTAGVKLLVGSIFQAAATLGLTDIPASMNFYIARKGNNIASAFPIAGYSASASTLDMLAEVKASLFNVVNGGITFKIANLGQNTTATFDLFPPTLRMTSSPQTELIELRMYLTIAAAYQAPSKLCLSSGSNCGGVAKVFIDNGAGEGPQASIDAGLTNFGFTLRNFKTFNLSPGVLSAISGDYGSFNFGYDQLHAHPILHVRARAEADLGVLGTYGMDLFSYHVDVDLNMIVQWHKFKSGFGEVYNRLFDFTIAECRVKLNMRPTPQGQETNNFTVAGFDGGSGTWMIVPDPQDLVPDLVVDAIAFFLSPVGRRLQGILDCTGTIADYTLDTGEL